MSEHELQNAIREALLKRDYIVLRHNVGTIMVGEGADRRPFSSGLPRGFPDLQALKNGVAGFIEVKTPAGRLTKYQAAWQITLRDAGFRVGVARSVEDAIEIMEG